ncbi:hypothetical protein CI109_100889 [Kwoniella shandongensis]|uniref:Uncharacterized protein n=1 Tax=Kwoniella shandongensis TaxID=1734106 RepID=A0A5M6BX40_9TREE|nr:uncharacterized protein CI109_006142 [Kwoniella shandongensis]KAA5525569.1 hypothetical protein CI109_006142 [Kwoniella shandongensis]
MGRDDYDLESAYGYTPTEWVTIVFIVVFAVSGAVHVGQAIWFKYWIVFPTIVIGIILELIGWAARYWSSQNVLYDPPFLQQIITLIIAPVFFSAWCYTILGLAINRLGQQYSALRPKWYLAIFITCDIISLVLQAVGGGWAASASDPIPKTPTNIMVGGIIFQLVSMVAFSSLALDFMIRATKKKAWKHRQSEESMVSASENATFAGANDNASWEEKEKEKGEINGWWIVLAGTAICSLMIIIRGVYRSVELVQGWNGYLISHEVYQDTLDGLPMSLAMIAVNILHPGFFLPKRRGWRNP